MITVMNRIIPFRGFTAVTLWPLVFVRSDACFDATARRHERIHLEQQLEVLAVSAVLIAAFVFPGCLSWPWLLAAPAVYYVLYGADWLLRLAVHRDGREAYRNIVFEQEAYSRQQDGDYIRRRRPLEWLGFVGQKTWSNPSRRGRS